jgi:hypothetical protein
MNAGMRLMTMALALSLCGIASAGAPGVDARQQRQAARIEQGVLSGQLTGVETARLQARQQHLSNVERRAEADGVVTARERARLHLAQDRNSRSIARQKHDRQRRY